MFWSRSPQRTSAPKPPVAPKPSVSGPATVWTGGPRAVRLVAHDERGKFFMDPEAIAVLRRLKGPLAVVSVCGRARQGKSFILNQLLGQSSGFQVGPTHRPCTKGLWMWSSPIERTAPDGSRYHLLLLDSEGIEAYDQTGTYSTQIFSLAVLLSSLFVFNQMGGIDEAALDNLALVTELSRHIRVRAEAGGAASSAHELGAHSPVFVWLLRDFYLDLTEDGHKISPRDYLEEALKPMPGNNQAVLSKNQIRESIRQLFPNRDCFALVRPLTNETQLQRLDEVPMENLRPEFRQGLQNLTLSIYEKALPKRMGNSVLTGPILASLTQAYLDAINAGAVPVIASSWQSVEEQQCRLALDKAVEAYMEAFDKNAKPEECRKVEDRRDKWDGDIGTDGEDRMDKLDGDRVKIGRTRWLGLQDALRAAHKAAMAVALPVFEEEALGTGSVRQNFQLKLLSLLESRFEERRERMCTEAELRCREVLARMEARLQTSASKKDATPDGFFKVLEEMVKEYQGTAVGPAKWNNLAIFLSNALQGVVRTFVLDLQEHSNEKVTRLEGERERIRGEVDDWKSRAQISSAQLSGREEELTRMRRQGKDLEGQLAALLANQSAVDREKTAWLAKLDKAAEDMGRKEMELEASRKESVTLKKQVAKQAELLRERDTKVMEMTARVSSQTAAIAAASKERGELQISLEKARQELKVVQVDMENWQRRHSEAVEGARKQREEALTESTEQRKRWQEQREGLQRKKDAEFQQLKAQYSQQMEEVARLSMKLEDVEAELLSTKQSLTVAHLQVNALHEELEVARGATMSANTELQASRELQMANQRELQKAVQALRQAENAKVSGELQWRKEAELLQQSEQRVEELEKSLKEQAGLASELKARNEVLEKELRGALVEKAQIANLLDDAERKVQAAAMAESAKQEGSAREGFSGKKRRRRDSEYASTVEGIGEGASDSTVGGMSVNIKMTKQELRSAITDLGFGDKLSLMRNPPRGELLKLYLEAKEGNF